MILSLAAGASGRIGGTTSLYFEAGWFPHTNADADPLVVGAGLIALASTDVQLDIGVDFGLGESSGDWSAGLGLCWRWGSRTLCAHADAQGPPGRLPHGSGSGPRAGHDTRDPGRIARPALRAVAALVRRRLPAAR